MAYEQKDNSGSIFKNDKKGNDKAPDYNGTIIVEGVEKRIALWVKKSNDGKTSFFSASISEAQPKTGSTGGYKAPVIAPDDDDLPF